MSKTKVRIAILLIILLLAAAVATAQQPPIPDCWNAGGWYPCNQINLPFVAA
jgi:hypothetical protein